MFRLVLSCAIGAVAGFSVGASASDPWADRVEFYEPGAGVPAGYDDANVALGSPTRYTGEGVFPGAVTPFNSPFLETEVVSIGRGGSLTVFFNEPVRNDPLNPFGIDLLIFGNSFYFDDDFPNGRAGALSSEGGLIEVSQDGLGWHTVVGIEADGLYPTLGYTDLTGPFDPNRGSVETDFTLPVDPSFDPSGRLFSEIVAGYNGSGGGAGVDIGLLNLDFIQYVRISNAIDSATIPEIDGFADVRAVPGSGAIGVLVAGGLFGARRRRGATA